jgi:hypothetical protein
MASIHWDFGPVRPVRADGYPLPGERSGVSIRQELVHCRYFELEYVRQNEPFSLGGAGRLQVAIGVHAIGVHGRAQLRTHRGQEPFGAGETLVFPADSDAIICTPEGSSGILLATLPDPL